MSCLLASHLSVAELTLYEPLVKEALIAPHAAITPIAAGVNPNGANAAAAYAEAAAPENAVAGFLRLSNLAAWSL